VHWYWEFDQLETGDSDSGTSLGWETRAWIGKDTRRLWLRTRGERVDGRLVHAGVELLGSRSVSAWWDVVAGVRHDTGEGPSRSFAAIGVQGLAPYKIDVEATAYLGDGGRTAARVEAGYDTLLTNRLVLQWDVEADVLGRDDPQRRLGAGLSSLEAGARLRYEVTRQFAPYLGVVHERSFGRTADFRRDDGAPTDDTRVVAGVRLWF
jgi:copper resistance protein B